MLPNMTNAICYWIFITIILSWYHVPTGLRHLDGCKTSWHQTDTAPIDLLHKSHNAPVQHPTVHHVVTEMCTHVHISVTTWCIVGYLSDALSDVWDGTIQFAWLPSNKLTEIGQKVGNLLIPLLLAIFFLLTVVTPHLHYTTQMGSIICMNTLDTTQYFWFIL